MAATMAQIRAGIKTNLETALGTTDLQITAYPLDNPTPPCVRVLGADEIDYDIASASGLDEYIVTVQGLVGGTMDIGAQTNLDLWIARGTGSVKNAIETDRTLGGTVDDCVVVSCTGNREYQLKNFADPVIGAEWKVRILNRGN